MALYDDPKKKKPVTPLQQQVAGSLADYGASVNRMSAAQSQAQGIQIPMPIIREGKGTVASVARPGTNAAVTALGTLGGVARQEQANQQAMVPALQQQTAGLRQQAATDRVTAANLGANKLLAGVGASPIAAPVATPRPAVQPTAAAAIASPGVRFAGIDAAPDNFYRNPPGTKPRNAAELNQASQAEVAARNQASLPGTASGAGAPTPAGAGAPITKSIGKFGETVFSNTGSQYATPTTAGTIGSVQSQNFGNPAVSQGPGAIAGPRVASTFGMGVNDPRLNDQTRAAAPAIQAPQNLPRPQASAFDAGFASRMGGNAAPIERPGANFQMAVPNGAAYRSADKMAEQYNSREDRAARQAVSGNIDTALFLARGKPGSEAVMSDLLQTQARLNSGAEALSQEAIQGRATRGNQFGIADLNNAGENNRAGIQADVARGNQQVTREGQQLDFQAKSAAIARPELKQDANGNYVNISGNTGTPVVDAAGNPVRGQQTQADTGQITPALQLTAINNELKSLAANPPMTEDAGYNARVQALRSQQEALLSGGNQAAAAKPSQQDFLAKAKQANPGASDADLIAYYNNKYGSR